MIFSISSWFVVFISWVAIPTSEILLIPYHKMQSILYRKKPWIFYPLYMFSLLWPYNSSGVFNFLYCMYSEKSSPTRHQWKYGKYVSLQWDIYFMFTAMRNNFYSRNKEYENTHFILFFLRYIWSLLISPGILLHLIYSYSVALTCSRDCLLLMIMINDFVSFLYCKYANWDIYSIKLERRPSLCTMKSPGPHKEFAVHWFDFNDIHAQLTVEPHLPHSIIFC
jgi:hypothetical protein